MMGPLESKTEAMKWLKQNAPEVFVKDVVEGSEEHKYIIYGKLIALQSLERWVKTQKDD